MPFLPPAALALAALCPSSLCIAQQWRSISPPTLRSEHAVAFDTWRNRTVLYGGRSPANNGLEDTWVFDGAEWHGVPTAISPGRRLHHTMAFDALRGVTVLFGGQRPDGTRLGDTWEFDGTTWTQIPNAAPAPTPRTESAMVYDSARQRIVLFGGLDGSYRDDTWVYDGMGWTQETFAAAPPPARYGHAMACDVQRGVTVLFGGYSAAGRIGDTWELDLAATPPTWTQKALTPPNAPGVRYGHVMTYDVCGNVTVLFGGIHTSYLGDCWTYDGTTWTPVPSTTTAPLARYSAAMAFDTRLCRAVLFGGQTPAGVVGETWLFATATAAWSQIPLAIAPPPRMGSGMAFDGRRHRFVMFGGVRIVGSTWSALGDTWELVPDWTWTQVQATPPNAPSPRFYPAVVYDSRNDRTVLFGGAYRSGSIFISQNDTWHFDGTSWVQQTPSSSPSPRHGVGIAFDSRRGRTVLFGGMDQNPSGTWLMYDETWEYDGTNWNQIPTTNEPSPRGPVMTYDAGRGVVVLFGGMSAQFTALGDTWEYDGTDWTQVQPTVSPSPRSSPLALAYDAARGVCLLHGGFVPSGSQWSVVSETWEYDGRVPTWTQVSVPGPAPRGNNVVVYDPGRGETLTLWGDNGGGGGRNADDAWAFVPAPAARWTSYGFGCAGTNGRPTLTNATLPQLGQSLQLDVDSLPTAGGLVFLAHGFDLTATGGVALPVEVSAMPGCQLWIDPAFAGALLHAGGIASFTLPIPSDPALAGTFFSSQALAVDLAAANGLGALSNAGIATVN